MSNYKFGAGGFKLGDRVEILTTGLRGILIGETIHISGCNTYEVLLPTVSSEIVEGRMKITHRDYLMLRKLDTEESIFDKEKTLNDDNSFSPKGTDVSAEWIYTAVDENKEYITEIDDGVGVEEFSILPGTEVWNKIYGKIMIVTHITRDIYSKELVYGAIYMVNNKEIQTFSHAYSIIPLEQKINIKIAGKTGAVFEDGRDNIRQRQRSFVNRHY